MKMPICLPYIHTPEGGLELKHCLRSLKNLKNFNGEVYVIGDKENWFNNITHIPVRRTWGKPYLDQIIKMKVPCELPGMPDQFIAYMDDIFTLEPIEATVYYRGQLEDSYSNFYQRTKKYTAEKLKNMGYPTLDYETHAPMVVNKERLLTTLNTILVDKHKHNLQWRSMYGNTWGVEAELFEDKKTKTSNLKEGSIISTNFYTGELNTLFPEPSIYELDGVE